MMRAGAVSTGLYLEMKAELLAAGWRFAEDDQRKRLYRHSSAAPDPNARPYQAKAVDAMLGASDCGGIVLVATGAGKTRLTGDFFRRVAGHCLFIVDELTLLEQARKELTQVTGERVGVVGRGEFTPERVTVATVQTLHRRREVAEFKAWFRKVSTIVVDELHLALGKRNLDVVRAARPLACYGLTATLEFEKPHVRKPAAALCGPVIFRYPLAEGVEEGYLSRGVAVCVAFHDPLRGDAPGYSFMRGDERISIKTGSTEADYRYRIALSGPRNRMVAELAREGVARGRRVIVLVERLAHLRALSRHLTDVAHGVVSGAVKSADRFADKDAMEAGALPLLLATRVFGKGIDIKTADTVIDATGLPSRNNAQQRYGRGTRLAETKHGLIYLDIADRGNRHAGAAYVRQKALRDLGVEVIRVEWRGDAAEIYKAAQPGSAKRLLASGV
jgi:superfamily II DNA or RNA helicase